MKQKDSRDCLECGVQASLKRRLFDWDLLCLFGLLFWTEPLRQFFCNAFLVIPLVLVGIDSTIASDFVGNSGVDLCRNPQAPHALETFYYGVEEFWVDILFDC